MRLRRERKETVAWVVGLSACDWIGVGTRDLDVEGVPAHEVADLLRVLFVHPRLEFTPPEGRAGRGRGCGRRGEGLGLRGGRELGG